MAERYHTLYNSYHTLEAWHHFWGVVQIATLGSSWRDVQDRYTKLSIVFVVIVIIIIIIVVFLVGECPSRGIGKGKVVAYRGVWVVLRGIEQFAKFFFDKQFCLFRYAMLRQSA
jgi:hypothetical membrane protein